MSDLMAIDAMNFCLPIDFARLQNDRLWLVPIEECTDENLAEYLEETCVKSPELWTYMPHGTFDSVKSYKDWYYSIIHPNPAAVIFAIYLKAGSITKSVPGGNGVETLEIAHGTFAGTTGLINASVEQSKAEIGHVMVLPKFHRTFVNTHASCLLLRHCLGSLEDGDLSMRRMQWQANSMNGPSIAAAQRLGMTLEGIIRWDRVVKPGKPCVTSLPETRKDGLPGVDRAGNKLGPGRHSAMLSLCWDDWLDGQREHVLALLSR